MNGSFGNYFNIPIMAQKLPVLSNRFSAGRYIFDIAPSRYKALLQCNESLNKAAKS
jgi:hypothetical protein